jgi:hypothetical protein
MPQISRGKFDRLRRATAGFTTGELDGYGLRDHWPARPPPYASDPVFVHRLASLLCASFRPRLAASVISPLRFAITSRPSRCEEDLHLLTVEHARHTQKMPRPKSRGIPAISNQFALSRADYSGLVGGVVGFGVVAGGAAGFGVVVPAGLVDGAAAPFAG